jgi:hypothetical protein
MAPMSLSPALHVQSQRPRPSAATSGSASARPRLSAATADLGLARPRPSAAATGLAPAES